MREVGATVLKYLSRYASSGILLLDIKPLLSFKEVGVNTYVCSSSSLFFWLLLLVVFLADRNLRPLFLLPGTAGIVVSLYILGEQYVEFI